MADPAIACAESMSLMMLKGSYREKNASCRCEYYGSSTENAVGRRKGRRARTFDFGDRIYIPHWEGSNDDSKMRVPEIR